MEYAFRRSLYKELEARIPRRNVRDDSGPELAARAFTGPHTSPEGPVKVKHDDLWVELTFDLT